MFFLIRTIVRVLWAGFTAIWMVGAAVVAFIVQMFIPSDEERLRRLNKPDRQNK